ncbi:MAG TPA: succinate dehydrogenase, cytochrome b556 subunit [Burkholderiaceae bacterium]|jgi:succinate dehydrogenase / fumarate reductase cytochrome b subunit|nr:succinate dehydrogenase, cytochrome b556 subunit [Burkholderiaceae bacterium]
MATDTAPVKTRPQFRNIHVSQILSYRLPAAGIVSILHRISGALLFLLLPLLLWLFELSLTSEMSFERLRALASHWLIKLILLGALWGLLHHLVAGIRYLVIDLHIGLEKEQARRTAVAVFAISLPLTLLAALKIFGVF